MTLYRGFVIKSAGVDAAESVVVTGACCAVPFQVAQLNMAWFEVNERPEDSAASQVRVSVQSVTGHQPLESASLLAVSNWPSTVDQLANTAQVILPVQSTSGTLIVRVESVNVAGIVKAHFAIDVSFITLKELDYMRLIASGY